MNDKLDTIKYFTKLQNKISEEEKERQLKKKQGTKRIFTHTEDELLLFLVNLMGEKKWKEISKLIPGKSVRQCRERYKTYLKPGLNLAEWTPEDDKRLKELVNKYGPKWAVLTSYFPGRTDNALKNRYNVHLNENKKPRKKTVKTTTKEEKSNDVLINLLPDDLVLSYDSTFNLESMNVDNFDTNIDLESQNWMTNLISLDY